MRMRTHKPLLLARLARPIIVSNSFLLKADIDSPHEGIIHALPQNLIALSHAIKAY